MKQLLLVGFGGFIGSVLRFWLSKLNVSWYFHAIPMGTLMVNILGSLLIGFLFGIFAGKEIAPTNLRLFLIVGFCGGFTTFSAFTNENATLLQNGEYLTSFIYIAGSIIFGILAVFIGFWLANLFTN